MIDTTFFREANRRYAQAGTWLRDGAVLMRLRQAIESTAPLPPLNPERDRRAADDLLELLPQRQRPLGRAIFDGLVKSTSGTQPSLTFIALRATFLTYGLARRLLSFVQVPKVTTTATLAAESVPAAAGFVAAGTLATAADPTFTGATIPFAKIISVSSTTQELLEDSAVSVIPFLAQSASEGILCQEDRASFIGDGGVDFGLQVGLLNAGTTVVSMEAGMTSFEQAGRSDYKAMVLALPAAKRAGAMWLGSGEQIQRVLDQRGLDGRPLNVEVERGQLLGFPIANFPVGIEPLSEIADGADTKFLMFGNPGAAILGVGDERVMDARSAVLQGGDGSISANVFQADSAAISLVERMLVRLMRTDAIAVLKTAAA